MQIAEIIDEGVKSKMAAAGLAGLIAGTQLSNDPTNVDPNSNSNSSYTQQQERKNYQPKKVKLHGVKFNNLDRLTTELYFNIINLVNSDPNVTKAEIYTGDYVGTTSVYLKTTYDPANYKDRTYGRNDNCNFGLDLAAEYMEKIPGHRNKIGMMRVLSRTGEDIGTVSHSSNSYGWFNKYKLLT